MVDRTGLSLKRAALVAGLAYLLNPVTFAEFRLWPAIAVPNNAAQTVANIVAHHGAFVGIILCYFVCFMLDIVTAWALYFLLAPVNKALSLLASLFQLVYAAMVLTDTLNLVVVYRMVISSNYVKFGTQLFLSQIDLRLHEFRYDYSFALIVFAIHLILAGVLIARSKYIPAWLGIVLIVDGAGWIVTGLQPFLFPGANLDWILITALGELVFMVWLIVAGLRRGMLESV